MNERYVIDAYAWIEYLIGSEPGEKVRAIVAGGASEIYTSAVTVAEIISKTAREGRNIETAYDIIVNNSNVVNVNEEISKETGVLHAEIRKSERDFGLADAYVLVTARRIRAKILTGDPHFKRIREAVLMR